MKKFLFASTILIAILIILFYYLIPSKVRISGYETISLPALAAQRGIRQVDQLSKWWPSDTEMGIKVKERLVSSFNLEIEYEGRKYEGAVGTINKENKQLLFYQLEEFNPGNQPLKRLTGYFKARNVKSQMEKAMTNLKELLSDNKNIYGTRIVMGKVQDTTLVSAKMITDHYPTIDEIYDLKDKLQDHIRIQNGIIRDSVMLNITSLGQHEFQTMIAFPLLRDIPVGKEYTLKKMVLGNLLITEVTGGPATIEAAEISLKNFISDHLMSTPAIEYQQLLTNRKAFTDSSKWVTRVSFPVF